MAILGYSDREGATYQLAYRLWRNTVPGDLTDITLPFTVPYTAYIDAITSSTAGAENRRPPLSGFHCNQWETNTWYLHGGPSSGDDDFNVNQFGGWGANLTHGTIDDNPTVTAFVIMRLEQRVSR